MKRFLAVVALFLAPVILVCGVFGLAVYTSGEWRTEEEVAQWYKALNTYTVFRGGVNDFPYQKYYPTNLQIRQIESGSSGATVCYMYASLIENELW